MFEGRVFRACRGRLLLCVVAGGVAGPCLAGLGCVAVRGQMAVAEGLGDDGDRGLADEVAQGGGAGGRRGDAELAQRGPQRVGVEGLPGPAAGEQPAAGGVGRGAGVLPARGQLEEQAGEGLGDRDGRVAEPQEQLPVLIGDVVDGEADDAGDRLGEQQQQAGRGPGADRGLVVGERPAQQVLMTLAESPQSCSAEFPTLLGVRLRDLRLVVLSSSDQFSVCATPR